MARVCTICGHDDRLNMEQALVNGKSLNQVATQFGVARSSLNRHKNNCVAETIAVAKQAQAELRGLRLVDRVRMMDQYVDEVIHRARHPEPVTEVLPDGETITKTPPPNDRIILAAVKEARSNAELVAKMLGDIPPEDAADKARAALLSPETTALAAELEERISAGGPGATDP